MGETLCADPGVLGAFWEHPPIPRAVVGPAPSVAAVPGAVGSAAGRLGSRRDQWVAEVTEHLLVSSL